MAQLGKKEMRGMAGGHTHDDVPFDWGTTSGSSRRMDVSADAQRGNDGLAARFGLVGRRKVVLACCLVVVFLAVVGIARLQHTGDALVIERQEDDTITVDDVADDDGEATALDAEITEVSEVVVHVDGAVVSPGVYHLTLASPRVGDAVEAAGGLTDDADTTSVNLAETLNDGTKVHIYRQGELESLPLTGVAGGVASTETSGTEAAFGLININTASAEELETLPGVGAVTAQAIIAERERNGPFATTDELVRVDGIGEKRYAKVRDLICV